MIDFIISAKVLNEKNVFNAIEDVVKVRLLGLQLDFKDHKLQVLEANHPNDVIGYKLELVSQWLSDHTDASWLKLVSALQRIGHKKLADTISREYIGRSEHILISPVAGGMLNL